MNKVYQNPPIQEVICEVFFSSNHEWEDAYFDLLHDEIKDQFPHKNMMEESALDVKINVDNADINATQNPNIKILHCKNEAENLIIQISKNLLVINCINIYSGWDAFKKVILELLPLYQDITNITDYQRFNLRYINVIDIENHGYDNLKKHFTLMPNIPETITGNAQALQTEIEIPQENNLLLIKQMTLQPTNTLQAPVLFDLSYMQLSDFQEFGVWLEKAHSEIKNTFEEGLTDFTKQKFN